MGDIQVDYVPTWLRDCARCGSHTRIHMVAR